jgi:hypothetical protein
MRTGDWLRMLARNRLAISPTRWGLAGTVTLASVMNSFLGALQRWRLGSAIEATRIDKAPIFIIGHWRSGTTLLHELLVQDERFTFPDTYACFTPNHFLLSRWFMVPWLHYLLPSRRPMDNMELGWERPQEDEFALLNMGLPSPYESLAFPNRLQHGLANLEFSDWDDVDRMRWKNALVWFLKCVTYGNPKQIVLKSPPHTCRIRALLEIFPQARFIHIARNPYALFASTRRMWISLSEVQGLQWPRNRGLDEAILDGFDHMYALLAQQKELVSPHRYVDVRYEDLIADPAATLEKIYTGLELGGFDAYLPRLKQYWQQQAGYATNRYTLPPDTCRRIHERWGWFFQAYGYATELSGEFVAGAPAAARA